MWVQRKVTGVLLNMTIPDENRQLLVNADAIPALDSLLTLPYTYVQYYCTIVLNNIAFNACLIKNTFSTNFDWFNGFYFTESAKSAVISLRNLASDGQIKLFYINCFHIFQFMLLVYEEIRCHAINTLRNLAGSSERNKREIVILASAKIGVKFAIKYTKRND
ncbi:2912_t:CDS:2 [Funneliformis geosporum]|nr:2912_t:CDS:2 [Funneliformis geosporum]